jgi:hypothetical protein
MLLLAACDEKSLGLPVSYTVKYEITGTASSVDITMENAGGNTEQLDDVPLPWSQSFTITLEQHEHFFAYVSAQNQGTTGTVTAKIYKDGSEFKTATSSGAYVIASASGSIEY